MRLTENRISVLVAVLLACVSCAREDMFPAGDVFSLKGAYESAKTKNTAFEQNARYHIYSYESVPSYDFANPYIDSDAEEDDGHIVFLSEVKTIFAGRTLDFYGVSLGTPDAFPASSFGRSAKGEPVFALSRAVDASGYAQALPDLRRGSILNQNGETSESVITIPFKHALSKLDFKIARQNVPQLVGAELEQIVVEDHLGGRYNIITRDWSLDAERKDNLVFDSARDGAFPIYTEEELTQKDHLPQVRQDVTDYLVFPQNGKMKMKVVVHVPNSDFPETIANNYRLECDLELDLSQIPGETGLVQNFEYSISLALANTNIQIVMVVPTMYPWLDGDTGMGKDELALGQPVYFGGVTWADRNVGAESSTYNNLEEWDKMRGYYFQFGRSVPYFVLPTHQYKDFRYSFTPSWTSPYYFIPELSPFPLLHNTSVAEAGEAIEKFVQTKKRTARKEGSTTYYYTGAWSDKAGANSYNGPQSTRYPLGFWNSGKAGAGTLAKTADEWEQNYYWPSSPAASGKSPITGEEKDRYAFVKGTYNESQPWWVSDGVTNVPRTWDDKSSQPCPKGWKIPSRDDWAGIMPLSKRTGDITFHNGVGGTSPDSNPTQQKTTTDAGINGYYGSQPFVYCDNDNTTYEYHFKFFKTKWKKTEYFNAGMISDSANPTKDRMWWHEVGGKFEIKTPSTLAETVGDPSPGYITHYLCVENEFNRNVPDNFESLGFHLGTLYAIKCQGTSAAYRMRWSYKVLDDKENFAPVAYYNSRDKYPVVLEIDRYPATETDKLEDLDDLAAYDWDYPSESMVFPISGYMYSEGPALTNSALESVYASSTYELDSKGTPTGYFYYVRLKHSPNGGSRYLMLFKMRRSYGMSVRCVKDNEVSVTE